MDMWRTGSALAAPFGLDPAQAKTCASANPSGMPARPRAARRPMAAAVVVLGILAQAQALAAADYRMKPVRPREPAPPPVVEYVPPPAPLACGTITNPPYDDAHCYGEYRPWRQEGCWWRHGFYVCPKPRTAYGPVHGFH